MVLLIIRVIISSKNTQLYVDDGACLRIVCTKSISFV